MFSKMGLITSILHTLKETTFDFANSIAKLRYIPIVYSYTISSNQLVDNSTPFERSEPREYVQTMQAALQPGFDDSAQHEQLMPVDIASMLQS